MKKFIVLFLLAAFVVGNAFAAGGEDPVPTSSDEAAAIKAAAKVGGFANGMLYFQLSGTVKYKSYDYTSVQSSDNPGKLDPIGFIDLIAVAEQPLVGDFGMKGGLYVLSYNASAPFANAFWGPMWKFKLDKSGNNLSLSTRLALNVLPTIGNVGYGGEIRWESKSAPSDKWELALANTYTPASTWNDEVQTDLAYSTAFGLRLGLSGYAKFSNEVFFPKKYDTVTEGKGWSGVTTYRGEFSLGVISANGIINSFVVGYETGGVGRDKDLKIVTPGGPYVSYRIARF